MTKSIYSKSKDILVSIAWVLTVIMGVALGMVFCLVPVTEEILELYKYIATVVALVCVGLIEIIMFVGLKGWTIKAVMKED